MARRELDVSECFSEYFDELPFDQAAETDCLDESAIGEDQGCVGCGANSEKFILTIELAGSLSAQVSKAVFGCLTDLVCDR